MVHKLRAAMGKRDGEYVLAGRIELDDGFFSTERLKNTKEGPLKRGRGSQKKSKVIVMAESEKVTSTKKGQKPRRVGYLKMKVVNDLQKETITPLVNSLIDSHASIASDKSNSYVNLHGFVAHHQAEIIASKKKNVKLYAIKRVINFFFLLYQIYPMLCYEVYSSMLD